MKTVQMTLDEDLLEAVDRAARRVGTSRSAFTRGALRAALASARVQALEERHRAGYAGKAARRGEFSSWEAEQVWPEP